MNTSTPFLIRGTREWDEREICRRAEGMKCISLGPIPKNQAHGESLAHKQQASFPKTTQCA